MQSMKSTTTGKYLLEEDNKCVAKLGLNFEKLPSVTTDGCPNLTGKNVGLLKRIEDQVAVLNPDQNCFSCIALFVRRCSVNVFRKLAML